MTNGRSYGEREAQQRFAVYALHKLPLPLSGNNKRGLVDIFKAEHLPNL